MFVKLWYHKHILVGFRSKPINEKLSSSQALRFNISVSPEKTTTTKPWYGSFIFIAKEYNPI